MYELIKEMEKETLNNSSIACFTAKNDNILMWSHYANGHKGVCFVFEVKERNIFSDAFPIKYRTKMLKIPFYYLDLNPQKYISATFLTKAKDYKYEKEYRIRAMHITQLHTIYCAWGEITPVCLKALIDMEALQACLKMQERRNPLFPSLLSGISKPLLTGI